MSDINQELNQQPQNDNEFLQDNNHQDLELSNSNTLKRLNKKKIKNRNPFEFKLNYKEIFTVKNINEIHNSINPKNYISQILEEKSKENNSEEIQSNLLMAQSEFHLQNLNFLEENFKNFPKEIICKLFNILALLMNLNEDDYNINYDESDINHLDVNIKKYVQVPEPDLGYIANRKLMEIKMAFIKLGLINRDKDAQGSNTNESDPGNEFTNNNFYLTTSEVETIISYLNQSYFPNLRLFYHFININRITETKKIHVTVNVPLPVPPLCEAVEQVIEKNIIEEIANKREEEMRKKEQKIREEIEKEEKEKQNPEKSVEDILSRLNLNNEVRKMVTEKVDEIKKDVDAKILEDNNAIDKNVELIKEQNSIGKKK